MTDLHEMFPDPALGPRTAAAEALRRLSEALVAHRADAGILDGITEWAAAAATGVRAGPPLVRDADYMRRRYTDPPPPDGRRLVTSSDRPVSGPANPSALDVIIERHGTEARARVVFDRRFESAPGRVHGGVTASVFDDVMGYVQVIEGVAAFTLELRVRYLAGMPLEVPVEFRARTTERTDRRSFATAEARIAGEEKVLADATATFALVPRERFGLE